MQEHHRRGLREARGTFDIKHGGLLPIVDLARYHALVGEIPANHTLDRLRAAADDGVLWETEARVLEEAFELFTALRLEHQVEQLEQGREPDDHIDPRQLDPLTRRYLRDAFREVEAVQRSRRPSSLPAPRVSRAESPAERLPRRAAARRRHPVAGGRLHA